MCQSVKSYHHLRGKEKKGVASGQESGKGASIQQRPEPVTVQIQHNSREGTALGQMRGRHMREVKQDTRH